VNGLVVRYWKQVRPPVHPHGHEADAVPGVAPAVEQLQFGLGGGEPQEAEDGPEATAVRRPVQSGPPWSPSPARRAMLAPQSQAIQTTGPSTPPSS
jgi:hypothetical protein